MFKFRRYLFLGLTAMLTAVLVYLVVQSRRIEAPPGSPRPVEIVRESHPTATRAIAPADLTGVCRVNDGTVDVEIRNSGRSGYRNVMLKLSFRTKNNTLLEPRNQLVRVSVAGGDGVSATGIPVPDLPAGAVHCSAQVLYADIE